MLKSVWRGIVAIGTSLVLAIAPAHARAAVARPALWEVSDPDTRIYLFGTIHLLPADYQWQTPEFQRAVADSQELIVETIVDLQHPQEFASSFAQLALSPTPLPPILERVPPEKRAKLKAALARINVTPGQLDRVKTWAVAFQLMGLQFADAGLKGQNGPEAVLRQQFTADNKHVGQLETIGEQLGFFNSMSEDAQRNLLVGLLDDPAAAKAELGLTLAAWARGDVKALRNAFRTELSGSPELRQILFDRRNANWSRWLEQRLAQPGTVMVAVGADHLAAKGSVIDLLKRDGYQVRRLQ